MAVCFFALYEAGLATFTWCVRPFGLWLGHALRDRKDPDPALAIVQVVPPSGIEPEFAA